MCLFVFFFDFHYNGKTSILEKIAFPLEKITIFGVQISLGGTFSELSAFRKESISNPKNLPKVRSKSIEIDLNFHFESYLKFAAILVG